MRGAGEVPDVVEDGMTTALEQDAVLGVVEQDGDGEVSVAIANVGDVAADVLAGETPGWIAGEEQLGAWQPAVRT